MASVILWAGVTTDFFESGAELIANPWGVVSLVDLYVGFILFSAWIAFREASLTSKVIWIALMMVFGFLTGAIYTLVALVRSEDKLDVLMLGARSTNVKGK